MSLKNKHIDYNILVERFQNGDRKALEILICNFHTDLKRIIQYHTKARQPVEDIAQECWHDIIQKLDELELKISFNAWAFTIPNYSRKYIFMILIYLLLNHLVSSVK